MTFKIIKLTIIIDVVIASITNPIAISIVLIPVFHIRAIIADVSHVIRTLAVAVRLVAIRYQGAIIRQIQHVVVVRVVVAGVA